MPMRASVRRAQARPPYSRFGRHRFSRSELLTTDTLENDIAAAAMMGFSVTLKNG